jgi:hypothetical protein
MSRSVLIVGAASCRKVQRNSVVLSGFVVFDAGAPDTIRTYDLGFRKAKGAQRRSQPRVMFQRIARIRSSNRMALSASPGRTIRQATASRSALRVSPALPAAVNSRARLFPGSEICLAAIERNAARGTRQLIRQRLVALFDARHQRSDSFDQLNTQLRNLKRHVVLLRSRLLASHGCAGVRGPAAPGTRLAGKPAAPEIVDRLRRDS